jgi:hypothetical protein
MFWAAGAVFAGDEPLPKVKVFDVDKPGWFHEEDPPCSVDPVPGLTAGEIEKVKSSLDDPLVEALIASTIDRIETTYTERNRPPEGFTFWLGENPEIRRTFWLALSPYYDNIRGAMKVLNQLRMEESDLVLAYPHMAVAIAVVWDNVNALYGSRYNCVRSMKKDQYPPLPDPLKVFRYYTDKKRQKKFLFKTDKLVWPILVHLADMDVSDREAEWAFFSFLKRQKQIGDLYGEVEYDYSRTGGKAGKLGDRQYILPHILEYGGICGDQAHFCSRVAKCLGIPAMKADGLSRYGGTGHAFTVYFVWKKGRPMVESTGRYFHDFYYTGNVYDPQTGTEILDRHVEMLLDGASLSYSKFIVAHALARLAKKMFAEHPKVSLVLVKKALTTNWFCGPAWKLLMRLIGDGHVPPAEGVDWANKMMKYVKDHPDLTLECFTTFIGCFPKEDVKRRQSFYKQAFGLYKNRPDLQIDLRIKQGEELVQAGEDEGARRLFLDTAVKHAKTGRLILPILEKAVAVLNRTKSQAAALPFFAKILKKYPRKRGDKLAKAFQDLVRLIAPVYEAAGKEKEAEILRMEAEIY